MHTKTWRQPAATPDRNALAAIYDEYHPPIYRYIYRQVSDVETARDLTAEVFHRLLQAIHRKQGPDQNLRAWLYRAAHNVVIDHYRRQKHRRHVSLKEDLVNSFDDPVKLAESHISAEQVRAALQQLTPEQQQVIALKFLGEMSNEEVAVILNRSIGAVKALQHRALAALHRRLSQMEEKIR